MELGTSVYTYLWECSLEGALERCAGFGFRTLELVTTPPFLRPAHFGPFERRRLGRLLGRLGLKVFSVNPTFLDLNLVSLNPAIRRASLKELQDTIWLAADIGARLVVISAGRRHPLIPAPYEDAFELALEGIDECLRLAEKVGLEPEGLTRTLERFNGMACAGRDLDFGRGETAYDRYYGDPEVKPNPNLAPIEEPPFYAVEVLPGVLGTKGGLQTDGYGRVLNVWNRPIPGLYACGNIAAFWLGKGYPGPGASIGPAMTFGYIAGRHAARA
ncbi:MAG: hypothetical protein C4316_05325 [Chloroflexota bacterium]